VVHIIDRMPTQFYFVVKSFNFVSQFLLPKL
jgi:hypothetical protein